MGIQQIPAAASGPTLSEITTAGNIAGWGNVSGLNKGQIFTTSGSWIVPNDVTYAHIIARGGDGANVTWNLASSTTITGATGGTSTVLGISAIGGEGGYLQSFNPYWSFARSAMSGITVSGIVSTTPGVSVTVTVGSGSGSFVSIMWSE